MNTLHIAQNANKLERYLAILVIASMIAAGISFTFTVNRASAASLTSVSDTLSSSAPGELSNHTFVFTTPTGISTGSTTAIVFPVGANEFSGVNTVTANDVDFLDGVTPFSIGTCAGSDDLELSVTASTLTFTFCTGASVAASSTVTVRIGDNAVEFASGTKRITNPTVEDSYEITIGGTMTDSGALRVAIVESVTITAEVATSLTFTILGLNADVALAHGATTTATSTATELDFGILPVNTPVTLGQQLEVATNAANGFAVTVEQDQELLSITGAIIDRFVEGSGVATPEAWAAPVVDIDDPTTWGHIGLTSDDADLNGGEFGTSTPLFAGNYGAPRLVFSHDGPADGSTQDKGMAKVAFRIQITELQEAANDYSNVIMYIATPTF